MTTIGELAHGLHDRGWNVYSDRPSVEFGHAGEWWRLVITGLLRDGERFVYSVEVSDAMLADSAIDLVDYFDLRMYRERQRLSKTTHGV